MIQLALARRYRPRTFQTMVGQEVVLRSLCNALDAKRLHHAYLFTGTRGVGKTTIARILAKCLNCEQGISATPCGTCQICREMDAGSFIDLIEVDAASRTKVEDTRDLLDNVQYLPACGRFKIYLIDEVHMLSNHSFNALLKTLEEPPAHVKFLLATTDPQKLPLTVLSRCLQFHLWRLPFETIVNYLADILRQEKVFFEKEALQELSRGADGSLRDALSLLDQALNFGNGRVEAKSVRLMLGFSEKELLLDLLVALAEGNSREVLQKIRQLAEKTPDFSNLLTELLEMIHHLAIAGSVPEALEESYKGREIILQLAKQISPEEVQLYYQIGLQGQRDLPFAPNPKIGFEMILLRMLAFQPVGVSRFIAKEPLVLENPKPFEENLKFSASSSEANVPVVPLKEMKTLSDIPEWRVIINHLNLSGLTRVLAEHCIITEWTSDFIHLILNSEQKLLLNKRYEERLQEALCRYLGRELHLKITEGEIVGETPAMQNQRLATETQQAAYQMIEVDSKIQRLIQAFDAKIEDVLLKDS